MYFKFVYSADDLVAMERLGNARYDRERIIAWLAEYESRGDQRLPDAGEARKPLIKDARSFSMSKHVIVGTVFGSNEHPWTGFGTTVPALLVYDQVEGQPSCIGLYPHRLSRRSRSHDHGIRHGAGASSAYHLTTRQSPEAARSSDRGLPPQANRRGGATARSGGDSSPRQCSDHQARRTSAEACLDGSQVRTPPTGGRIAFMAFDDLVERHCADRILTTNAERDSTAPGSRCALRLAEHTSLAKSSRPAASFSGRCRASGSLPG